MPDFNKGDFTQQGVNGHVNANVRLNEKRLVNIDLTSNEEAEGCTITGTVKDLLNDKVYNIGSGGGGGVEMLHCVVTIVNNTGENLRLRSDATPVFSSGGNAIEYPTYLYSIADNRSVEIDALYQAAPDDMFGIALVNATAYEGKTLEATASNEVNCSLMSMDAGSFGIILTNAENPSSITVTFTIVLDNNEG